MSSFVKEQIRLSPIDSFKITWDDISVGDLEPFLFCLCSSRSSSERYIMTRVDHARVFNHGLQFEDYGGRFGMVGFSILQLSVVNILAHVKEFFELREEKLITFCADGKLTQEITYSDKILSLERSSSLIASPLDVQAKTLR